MIPTDVKVFDALRHVFDAFKLLVDTKGIVETISFLYQQRSRLKGAGATHWCTLLASILVFATGAFWGSWDGAKSCPPSDARNESKREDCVSAPEDSDIGSDSSSARDVTRGAHAKGQSLLISAPPGIMVIILCPDPAGTQSQMFESLAQDSADHAMDGAGGMLRIEVGAVH